MLAQVSLKSREVALGDIEDRPDFTFTITAFIRSLARSRMSSPNQVAAKDAHSDPSSSGVIRASKLAFEFWFTCVETIIRRWRMARVMSSAGSDQEI